jgi:integrase/recombinase XerD
MKPNPVTQIILRPPTTIEPAEPIDPETRLLKLWLHGKSRHTRRAYLSEWRAFRNFCRVPIDQVRLDDLQAFADHLDTLPLVPGSRHRALAAVKSLFSYAKRVGILPFDEGQPLRMPSGKNTINERILTIAEVATLVKSADAGRDSAMLELLYNAGPRVSELCGLAWKDAQPRPRGGQFTFFGKGSKTRTVRVDDPTWSHVMALRQPEAKPGDRIFAISPSQVARIVRHCAMRAGIDKPVSPHWLRHCMVSHALDGGAPIQLVQRTAGHASLATTSGYAHARPDQSVSSFLPKPPPAT